MAKYYVYEMFGDIEGNPSLIATITARNKKEVLKKLPKRWDRSLRIGEFKIFERKLKKVI
jgi:hypothetical protein